MYGLAQAGGEDRMTQSWNQRKKIRRTLAQPWKEDCLASWRKMTQPGEILLMMET
jgi:hypothetical protein